jgi:hypothetical protein
MIMSVAGAAAAILFLAAAIRANLNGWFSSHHPVRI